MRVKGVFICSAVVALAASPAAAGPVEEANTLIKQGKASDAVALLEKAAEAAPSDCVFSKALGEAYFAAKDSDLGAMTYERFLKNCADHKDAGNVAAALAAHYDKKLGPEPRPGADALYRVPLPPRQTTGGRTEDDSWAYERDARVERLTKVEEAIEGMRLADYAMAARILEKRLVEEPGDAQAWRFLGTARAELGDVEGALEAYDKYLAIDSKAPDAEPIPKVAGEKGAMRGSLRSHARLSQGRTPCCQDDNLNRQSGPFREGRLAIRRRVPRGAVQLITLERTCCCHASSIAGRAPSTRQCRCGQSSPVPGSWQAGPT